jgi:hypothetical protein
MSQLNKNFVTKKKKEKEKKKRKKNLSTVRSHQKGTTIKVMPCC